MDNIFEQKNAVSAAQRQALTGKKGAVVWFTGLSGSGKSTVACLCEKLLLERGINAFLLDGDNLRFGLNANLGFSDDDRAENIRRIAETAALFAKSGCVAVVSAISPFAASRRHARQVCEDTGAAFIEVFVNTSLEVCEARDTKGLYKRARAGEIAAFTGISSPYEAPADPEITVDTAVLSAAEAADICADYALTALSLDKLTAFICNAAKWAGEAIMKVYAQDFAVEYKGDNSPLTAADLAANAVICEALRQKYSDFAILSEESKDDLSRLQCRKCFIVDPLDGTKEFVKRNGEFTVNIALSLCGKSVAGAVYVPVTGRLFYAAKGFGSFSQGSDTKGYFGCESRIRVSSRREQLTVMASRSHSDAKLAALLAANSDKIGSTVSVGSSLKGCLIAAGEADVYYRTGPTMEWDTAAMQCVVEQAGGVFCRGDGAPMRYNRENSLNDKGFFILNSLDNKFTEG